MPCMNAALGYPVSPLALTANQNVTIFAVNTLRKVNSSSSELLAFISSTYLDLQDFRTKVEGALARIEANFRSMKYFGSSEGEPLELCLQKLRQYNYYIGIIGHRCGAVHDSLKLSYTEIEYEEAKRLNLRRRVYFANSSVSILPEHVETDEKRKLLDGFKQKLKKENNI